MTAHPLAGKPAPRAALVNVPRLIASYYSIHPDPQASDQGVAFGTSGHRGSALTGSFNEAHILAMTQAICAVRKQRGIDGPLFIGMDTHALSEPAFISALEVLAANEVTTLIDAQRGYTPTPVISHAILGYNRARNHGLADGIVVTPSHNPPEDGGFKYNPPHGGPADTELTDHIERLANAYLKDGLRDVRRIPFERALRSPSTRVHDYIGPYVEDLNNVVDMEVIAGSKLKIGVDPMGGSGIAYWGPIAERHALDIHVVNDAIDPTFSFMTLDRDGRIRMDCSSAYAMASLIGLKDRYDVAFGNDTDYDRHGIVTPSAGLLNPNHYLAVAVAYLFEQRSGFPPMARIGKTLVSSSMINRVADSLGRQVAEVPVGFKWFVPGLMAGALGFAGEESAGASFLRRDGTVWTTDKDGFILDLLAAEITARTGDDPGRRYAELTARHGEPVYERIDEPATPAQKQALKAMTTSSIDVTELGGEPVLEIMTKAPANAAAIGGVKVVTKNGWFAARPSGTENVYKIYAESFLGAEHLARIQQEARKIVAAAFAEGRVSAQEIADNRPPHGQNK